MKTLEQIKNDYAVSVGFETWESLIIDHFHDGFHVIDMLIEHENQVMILVQKECLKRASENFIGASDFAVDTRNAITNENNIIK